MNEDYEDAGVADPEPDRRIVAMHRVVDLERQHEQAQREADRRAKMAAVVSEELRTARSELHELLGLPSSNAKAMSSETAKMLAAERFAR